jgi:Tol biopolymer transport system component
LFAGSRRIYAFALGAHSITWVSRTHLRGRFPGCELYVRSSRTGRTLRAPLPSPGCGVKPPVDFTPQKPVLGSGAAAWVKASSCGNTECFWKIATITGGETKARVIDSVDIGCPYTCATPHRLGKAASPVPAPFPHAALAGKGNLLVYSSGGPTVDKVFRIVGRQHSVFAVPPGLGAGGGIESLVAGGGAVGVVSSVLDAGDGCGCLDSPAWSPDGSKITYLHGRFWNQRIDPYPPSAAPAVMNADGSARVDLSTTTTANEGPAWSPDGKQVVYGETSPTYPYPEAIAVADADGSGAHEIGLGSDPAWSPDGSKIAFAAVDGSNNPAIFTMNPDGSSVAELANFPGQNVEDDGMAWSPDGTRIAFSLNGMLEMMNSDGGNPHPLGSGILGDEPAWSPDSSQIVFHTDSGLSVIDADGSNLRQLTNGPDEHPSWSPDGQTILFGSDRNDPYANANSAYELAFPELYFVDPDGSDLRPLSFTMPAAFEYQTTIYAASGKLLPALPGVPTLAGHIAAVGGTSPSGVHNILLFNARTGARLTVVRVGASNARFALAGATADWFVFHVGRTISAVNAHTHRVVGLARAAGKPLDVSVSAGRVAWAENISGHGRIRSVDLPN